MTTEVAKPEGEDLGSFRAEQAKRRAGGANRLLRMLGPGLVTGYGDISPEDAQITAVPFARAPLYAALSENHPAAAREHLKLHDLAADQWILFACQVHPVIHEAILNAALFGWRHP